jgi:site-specific recombinase XerD
LARHILKAVQCPVLTDEQVAAILAACRRSFTGLRDRALIAFLVSAGARRAEAIALTVADIHIGFREATIRRGKGGKGRVVPFEPRAPMRCSATPWPGTGAWAIPRTAIRSG